MANADQTMTDAPARLAKVETNIRWIAALGAIVIAALGWLNTQAYETRAEIGELQAEIRELRAEHGARLDSLEATMQAGFDRIEARMANIEAHLSE